jgi:hypothetical protein
MTLFEEINNFARGYIADKSLRSTWKKAKIREAYKLLTGENIIISCSTCYIEALLTIINKTNMAARNYELKKGVLLQAFGEPSKTCTNDTLTDELAQWHLNKNPEKAILFARLPANWKYVIPKNIEIIKPKEEAKVNDPIAEVMEEVIKPKGKRTSNKNK